MSDDKQPASAAGESLTIADLRVWARKGQETAEVQLPRFGRRVKVRALKTGEFYAARKHLAAAAGEGADFELTQAHIVALALCDDAGLPIVGLDDLAEVDGWPVALVSALWPTVQRLNGLGDDEGNA